MVSEFIDIERLKTNEKNPRTIDSEDFYKLVNSILVFPKMLSIRPVAVDYSNGNGTAVSLGGNQRTTAIQYIAGLDIDKIQDQLSRMPRFVKKAPEKQQELIAYWTKWLEHPVAEVVDISKLDEDEKEEFIIKDNVPSGKWNFEELANLYDTQDLIDWGVDLMFDFSDDDNQNELDNVQNDDFSDKEEEEAKEANRTKPGDIWMLGAHRLICGDSTKVDDVKRLMDGQQADLWITDPPYNVAIKNSKGMTIENDNMNSVKFGMFLTSAFQAAENVMKPGCPFYVWFASREHINFEQALNNNRLQVREELIWNKNSLVLGRQDYQWKHEPCQPAGTMVLTTNGEKPIEELKDGDRVISYSPLQGQIKGYKNGGYEIKTASRDYDGNMYSVSTDGKTTRCTDNHQFTVRFNAENKKNFCTYLMRRGDWWRVGHTVAYDARQFGLKTRMHQEKADAGWIIDVFSTRAEAQIAEQMLAVKYGIPYTHWEIERGLKKYPVRTTEQIKWLYDNIDKQKVHEGACRLLADYGRCERFPMIDGTIQHEKFSTRVTARIHACNLIPGLMQLPVPTEPGIYPNFRWSTIDDVTLRHEECKVYSLAVEKHEHYIADGIVTHNCLYGWKEGAGHYFTNSRSETTVIQDEEEIDIDKMSKTELRDLLHRIYEEKATTVINENKPTADTDHPTMKPIRLFGYQIANSSRKGEIVLDTFGGSGTTIVACEQLGRKARLVELDPHYCDVILARWEKLTGNTAVKISGTTTPQDNG